MTIGVLVLFIVIWVFCLGIGMYRGNRRNRDAFCFCIGFLYFGVNGFAGFALEPGFSVFRLVTYG